MRPGMGQTSTFNNGGSTWQPGQLTNRAGLTSNNMNKQRTASGDSYPKPSYNTHPSYNEQQNVSDADVEEMLSHSGTEYNGQQNRNLPQHAMNRERHRNFIPNQNQGMLQGQQNNGMVSGVNLRQRVSGPPGT